MIKLNLKIGTKIGLIMVLFVLLSVSMALIGRFFIKKFQLAATEHVPTLTFFGEALFGSKADVIKFAKNNMYADTLVISMNWINQQNCQLFDYNKDMKSKFGPDDEVNLDYKIIQQQAADYVNKSNYLCDLITELTIVRKSNLNTLKKLTALTANGKNPRVASEINNIVSVEYIILLTKKDTLFTSIESNIKKLKSTLPQNSELYSLVIQYEKGLNRIKELNKSIPAAYNQFESAFNNAWWNYTAGMKSSIISKMREKEKFINTYFIVIATIILIIGVTFTYTIVKSINQGVKDNYDVIKAVAAGDLSISINGEALKRTDEFGQLSGMLQNMIESQKDIIYKINVSAKDVDLAASQLKSSSENISSGANIQAASLEEISSSMEEMVSTIMQNTTNATDAKRMAESLSSKVIRVNEESVKSIESIKKIANKISIINDIAFQTNLLALNAAVEAARAGEYGRGFSVVAAEVKKLAERSRTASEEINVISRQSMDVTIEASKLLSELIPEINNTTSIVQEIASASIEQQSGSEQINNSIQQLNEITQQNASTSEELSEKSETLSNMSADLNEQIARFKL